MKIFSVCLTPKNSSEFQYSLKDLNYSRSDLAKPGISSDALTCFSSQIYGKKQSIFKTASTLSKLEPQYGDVDDQILDGEATSRQSFDIFNDDVKNRGNPRLSVYGPENDQLPSDRIYKQPKETIITRSLPQFEPGKKSLFALRSMDQIKSQTTEKVPTTTTIISSRRDNSPQQRRGKKSQTVAKRYGAYKLKV